MKKIQNKNKYYYSIMTIFIMATFVILPLIVSAEDYIFTGGGSNSQTTTGGGSISQSTSGGGSVSQTTVGGGSVSQTVAGGGSVSQTVAGGGSVSQTIAGGGSISQTVSGGGSFQVYQTQPGILYSGSQIIYANQPLVQTPTGITYVDYPINYVNSGSSQTNGGVLYTNYPTNYSGQIQSTNSNTYSTTYPTYYSQPTYYTQPLPAQNQVLAYTDTNPSLSSVYLSDVPYTGLSDSLPIIIFILSLILWSGILAYVFLKRKIHSKNLLATASISGVELINNKNHLMNQKFLIQIENDNSDISKVEEYARMNKVLLSSDAAAKLVKLARLGKIKASEFIKNSANGEWKAIGEGDIK